MHNSAAAALLRLRELGNRVIIGPGTAGDGTLVLSANEIELETGAGLCFFSFLCFLVSLLIVFHCNLQNQKCALD